MIHFLAPAAGAYTLAEYFELEPPSLVERFRVLSYEELPELTRLERGTCVLAGLDQLAPAMLALVARLAQQLSAEGLLVLNDPRRVLGRFELLTLLHRLGRNEFRIARPGADLKQLRYPVFVREGTSHDGSLSPLLDSPSEVEAALGRALLQGHRFDDLVVTEFCATEGADGLYRKYAAFKVGDRILARSLNAGRDWMLKLENSEFTTALALEEQDYVLGNPHAAELAELFDLAGIDYGQIDYAFKQGRVQTWEINLHPTIGRGTGPGGGLGPREVHPVRNQTREHFFDRFREAWAAIDQPCGEPAIPLGFDPRLRDAAALAASAPRRAGGVGRRLLRPLKPLLGPVSGPLLRALGAWRRRRGGS